MISSARRFPPWLVVAGLALLFALGSFEVVSIRFGRGDIYLPFSSYRTSRDGCKALFDSYRAMPGLDVSRLETPIIDIESPERTTLIMAGVRHVTTQIYDNADLRMFVMKGGRAVILLSPDANEGDFWFHDFRISTGRFHSATNIVDRNAAPSNTVHLAGVHEAAAATGALPHARSDVAAEWCPLRLNKRGGTPPPSTMAEPGKALRAFGAEAIPLNTRFWFDTPTNGVTVWYRDHKRPVMIERAVGKGVVIVGAASWFITNEGLRNQCAPVLLSLLPGGRPVLLFNENIHGIAFKKNIVWLAKKYRLGPFFATLCVLVAAYLLRAWAGVANVPHTPLKATGDIAVAATSIEGLENLLRHTVPMNRLLQQCVAEHQHAHARHAQPAFPVALPDGEVANEDDIVAWYNRLCASYSHSGDKTHD